MENGIIKKFNSLYEMYHFMIDNNYKKNITNYIYKHIINYITNQYIKSIELYDDMFIINYNGYGLQSEIYYMDLML